MRWFTDEPVKFTNWEDNPPLDIVPMDTCVALHSNTGKWQNVSCLTDVENGVICKTKQSKIEVHFFYATYTSKCLSRILVECVNTVRIVSHLPYCVLFVVLYRGSGNQEE